MRMSGSLCAWLLRKTSSVVPDSKTEQRLVIELNFELTTCGFSNKTQFIRHNLFELTCEPV